MRFLLLILVSVISGIFAGMGMGGGTFLVPILALFFHEKQIFCMSTNVFCFFVLAIFCVVIYSKKKLIDFAVVLKLGVPAMVVAGCCCLFSIKIESHLLRIIFACFIILLGVIGFISNLIPSKK